MDDLLSSLDKPHTARLSIEHIKRNIGLEIDDVVAYCRQKTKYTDKIIKESKNWYVHIDNYVITINAYSYTIITAHKKE